MARVLACGLLLTCPAWPRRAVALTGSDINATNTGPAAIGVKAYSSRFEVGSFVLRDDEPAAVVRRVEHSAVYDGIPVDGPHLLIQGVEIHGSIDSYSSLPLVIRGSKLVVEGQADWGIHTRSGSGPLYLLFSDISNGSGARSGELVWVESSRSVVFRNHLHGMDDDGMQVGGKADHVEIIENLMHRWRPSPGSHNDGIQMDGSATHVTFSRNKVLLNSPATGAINAVGWVGRTTSLQIDSNYLAGGSYTFYGPSAAGNSFTNNVFGLDLFANVGRWGAVYPQSWAETDRWVNNRTSDGRLVGSSGTIR